MRASTIYALGTFMNADNGNEEIEVNIALTLNESLYNSSPIVRRELIITTSYLINDFKRSFIKIVKENILSKKSGFLDKFPYF